MNNNDLVIPYSAGIILVGLAFWEMFFHGPRRRKQALETFNAKIKSAFDSLDVIVDGHRFLGAEAEVIKTFFYLGHYRDLKNALEPPLWNYRFGSTIPTLAEMLCRTKRGAWFYFDPVSNTATPCDEQIARNRLGDDTATYSKVFGQPDLA